MNEQLRRLRKFLDLTQQEFGARLSVKGNTIAQWESGRNNPPDSAITFICKEFNVNEEWLRNGTGEMFVPDEPDELNALIKKYGLTDSDRILIEKYISLKEEARETIIDFIVDVASGLSGESLDLDPPLLVPDTPEELEALYPPVDEDKENAG